LRGFSPDGTVTLLRVAGSSGEPVKEATMQDRGEKGAGSAGRGRRAGGGTTEEQEWHGRPLAERLRILRSGQGIPSFIDKATVDDRIKWLENEINTPGGLSARPKKDREQREGPGISGEARDDAQGSGTEARTRGSAGAGRRGAGRAVEPGAAAGARRKPAPGLAGEERTEVGGAGRGERG
jgi:hypothetical protein